MQQLFLLAPILEWLAKTERNGENEKKEGWQKQKQSKNTACRFEIRLKHHMKRWYQKKTIIFMNYLGLKMDLNKNDGGNVLNSQLKYTKRM